MTDPNAPPPQRPTEPVQHVTYNNNAPSRSGGGGWMALLAVVLVVVVAVIAWVVYSGGAMTPPRAADVDVDIDLPRPDLPNPPRLPEAPNAEPPTVTVQAPAPETGPGR